ncbi:alpha/beta fold hydrolase [Undibacterium crateris]|uniref:alpha/beta fold hydrolase n=1 Tax=Undibacterium crateris TaxID=2528175 RepID=UPI00138A6544|nr:alpha/beta hydrolase [Undibacterium crateris]NDI84125.1 alpha/beta fold hydrolase [Undibacterium crateris]
MQTIIHFVHGNGFPSGSYRAFLDHLRQDYEVQVTEKIGHQANYPVTDGWPHLVRELIDTLESRYRQPVILVGHSLGGLLSLMTAQQRPDLVKAVVVIDSPVVAGWRAMLLRVSKWLGIDKKFSPAAASENRRHLWPDQEAAYQHYAAKEIFAIWPTEVLWDYVRAGTMPCEQGVTLSFDRNIETAIYRTLPHTLGKLLRKRPQVPVGFVGGNESFECRQAGDYYTRQLMGKHYQLIQGGHLIPMEAPAQTAAAVLAMLNAMHSEERGL